jgi:hypothetical protein
MHDAPQDKNDDLSLRRRLAVFIECLYGMEYLVIFILAVIWLRLLHHVIEEAVTPHRKPPYKFVHPIQSIEISPRPSM